MERIVERVDSYIPAQPRALRKPSVQRKEHFFFPHRLRGLRFLLRLESLELDLKIPQGHLAMQQQIQG